MRHTCLLTSETHANGQKRGDSDEKVQKLWVILGGARAEVRAAELCIQRKRRMRVRKKQIHSPFSGPPIFPKIAGNDSNPTKAEKKKENHVQYFVPS